MDKSNILNILTLGLVEDYKKLQLIEAHRRSVMTGEEHTQYNVWKSDRRFTPRIGADIPCPLNLSEIDARISHAIPADPALT